MVRVLVVFGGKSAEHEVSCVSAGAVCEALTETGHSVVALGIDHNGGWHLADTSERPLEPKGPAAALDLPSGVLRRDGEAIGFDVVFPVLHGPFGEDGTIQGMLEMAGIRYVGCGVLASAVAMDKDAAKSLISYAGVPVVPWRVITEDEFCHDGEDLLARVESRFDYPVFVKPARMGSSVGVTRADNRPALQEGLAGAMKYGPKTVVEPAVAAREIEVAVLDGPRASVPGEIVIESLWYDYDAKYNDESSRFVTPAELTAEQTAEVRSLAERAFTALQCRGLARVDFFLDPVDGFLLNEVNTMPGFTPISGFPMMWAASGVPFDHLCDDLVQAALL